MKLITSKTNLRYLINFTGSAGFLLMGQRKNYFFTDFRYRALAQKLEKENTRMPFTFLELDENFEKNFKKIMKGKSLLEFEDHDMSVASLVSWKKRLKKMDIKGVKWKAIKNPISQLRQIKDEEEIKALKKSQKINDTVLKEVRSHLKPGMTELEVAWMIKSLGYKNGAEDISFEPIVAFDESSASPHHQNTRKKLKKNSIVLIDMGMKYSGYCSDMTRTFFMGKATNEQTNIYQKVLDAQLAAMSACKSGIKTSKLDKLAREIMGEHATFFGHSLGHGIGLDVHEYPSLSTRSKATLKENMMVTIEPGIYLPGKFGVRIEDMGRVTKNAYESFTASPK